MLENGISQRDLAKKLKVAPQTVSQFLGGKYDLRTDTLEKISKALNTPSNYFFDNSTDVKGNNNIIGKNIKTAADDPLPLKVELLATKLELALTKIRALEAEIQKIKSDR